VFAALHFRNGFPNGISGFFLVFIYGIMLGIIRRISKGMLAPVITHIAADFTIFLIIVFFVGNG
jgi:membrane protease YdiL (CAAX protease family)